MPRERLDLDFLARHTASPYLVGPNGYYLRERATRKPLVWDDAPMAHEELYLRVEGLAPDSDVACYGNGDEPALAAPNASLGLALPRLAFDGACAGMQP